MLGQKAKLMDRSSQRARAINRHNNTQSMEHDERFSEVLDICLDCGMLKHCTRQDFAASSFSRCRAFNKPSLRKRLIERRQFRIRILELEMMSKRKRTQVQLRADKMSKLTSKPASSDRYQSPTKALAPSDHWSGFGQWVAGSDNVKSVRKGLDEANFDNLCSIALEARKPLLESQQAKQQ